MTTPITFRATQHGGTYLDRSILPILTLALIIVSTCRQNEKKYTWADRFPQDDCVPRTPQAKAQLAGCPKLADPQHPTPQEAREFVEYMNKKQAIEGTVEMEGLQAPGCVEWRIDPRTGQPSSHHTEQKQGCINTEQQLKKFKIP